MSRLAQANGDDHPEAAAKHLSDFKVLLQQKRFDGAAYLSGYVVECSLKTLWIVEVGSSLGDRPWGRRGHDVPYLWAEASAYAAVAGAKTAKYYGPIMQTLTATPFSRWNPELRYRPPMISEIDAEEWCRIAEAIFNETVASMLLDGVI